MSSLGQQALTPMALNSHPPTTKPVINAIKRMLDIVLAGGLLVLSLPLMGLCIGLIKWADPGPAIYSQWRVGLDGWLFRIHKLRTMYRDAEQSTGAVWAKRHDDRIIGVCRWMRRSHIDELPQLWNILRGEMSLVGPRPERPEIHDLVRRRMPTFDRRLVVRPGLTGLSQLRNGYTNDLEGTRRKLRSDLYYIRRMGLVTDLMLILRTTLMFWDRRAH
jgi:lipopolysaccharide/colanic/teichoic acid biosynthesis glycosyltransferase